MVYASGSDNPVIDGRLNTYQGSRGKQDVPGALQYVIRCNKEGGGYRTPWSKQATVDSIVSYTTCSKLLETQQLTVKPSKDSTDTVYVPLIPVQRSQIVQGVKLETYLPGQLRSGVSSCCNPSSCPDECLKYEEAQKCVLMILEPTVIHDPVSTDSEWTKFFSGDWGAWGKGNYYPSFNVFMEIPCDYCPAVNCVRNCTNGEYVTGYANYIVSQYFF